MRKSSLCLQLFDNFSKNGHSVEITQSNQGEKLRHGAFSPLRPLVFPFLNKLTPPYPSCAPMLKRLGSRWPRPGLGMSGDAAGRQTWQQPARPTTVAVVGRREQGARPGCLDNIAIRSLRAWPQRSLSLRTSSRGQLRGCRGRCCGRERQVRYFLLLRYFVTCHPHRRSGSM